MKNPYKTVRVAASWVLGFLLTVFVVYVVIGSAAFFWGWWAFLWLPLCLVGLAVASLAFAALESLGEAFERWWKRKERDREVEIQRSKAFHDDPVLYGVMRRTGDIEHSVEGRPKRRGRGDS